MDTIIEREVRNNGSSSDLTAVVAIIAIAIIAGIALYVLRIYPFNVRLVTATEDVPDINVNVTGSAPSAAPFEQ